MTRGRVFAGDVLLRGRNFNAAERWFTEASKYPGMLGEAYGNLGVIALRRVSPRRRSGS